jgi:hypothetical protein
MTENECKYIRKVIQSCKTEDQFESCKNWINNLSFCSEGEYGYPVPYHFVLSYWKKQEMLQYITDFKSYKKNRLESNE